MFWLFTSVGQKQCWDEGRESDFIRYHITSGYLKGISGRMNKRLLNPKLLSEEWDISLESLERYRSRAHKEGKL